MTPIEKAAQAFIFARRLLRYQNTYGTAEQCAVAAREEEEAFNALEYAYDNDVPSTEEMDELRRKFGVAKQTQGEALVETRDQSGIFPGPSGKVVVKDRDGRIIGAQG